MRIKFGSGKVSIAPATQGWKQILIIEDGKRYRKGVRIRPGREKGVAVPAETLDNALVLEFENEESVQVLIDALIVVKRRVTVPPPPPLRMVKDISW